MKERYKHLLNFIANLVTLIVDGGLFAGIWYGYYAKWVGIEGIQAAFHQKGNWAVIGIYLLFVFSFTRVLGGYRIGYMRASDIILSNVLALAISNIVAYLELCLICRDYVNPGRLISCAVCELVFIVIWNILIRQLYKSLYPPRQMLLVYGKYAPDEMISKIHTRYDKYNISNTISYDTDPVELYNTISAYKAVVLSDLPDEERNQLMKFCYLKGIRVYVNPKISDIIFSGAENIHLFDTPLLLCRNQGLSIDQRFFKRLMDIVISVCGIVITSPILLVTALAVKLYDGGPVIYKQKRLTLDEKEFDILKFRSMRVGSEKDHQITMKGDSRITPVGRVIRKLHIDEFPQFFNILKGEMSFVGPRPEWKVTTDKYTETIPEFRFRLKVKAGLTGYAQVWGKYNTTPLDKLKMDLEYIEHYSIWLDIRLILLTVKILFKRESTEGVDAGQKDALKK